MDKSRLAGEAQGFRVHMCEHQDRAVAGVGDNCGDQPARVEPRLKRQGFVEIRSSHQSEKPLATGTKEARRLLDAARKKRLRVGSAPDTFLGGAHQTARRLIDEGAIGKPLSGTAFMMNHGHEHWHPDPGFYYAAGGGPMFDMGPYYLTNLVNLLGPVAQVSGVVTAGFAERKVLSEPRKGQVIKVKTPTHVTGLLSFVGGAVISITTKIGRAHV